MSTSFNSYLCLGKERKQIWQILYLGKVFMNVPCTQFFGLNFFKIKSWGGRVKKNYLKVILQSNLHTN